MKTVQVTDDKGNIITSLSEYEDAIKGITAEGYKVIIDGEELKNEKDMEVTMSNAEWCLNNGIKFADIQLRNCKRMYGGGYYVARKDTDEKIGHIIPPAVTDSGNKTDAYYAFRIWLDQKHEDYKAPEDILTGEERGYLKSVFKPLPQIVSVEKNYGNSLTIQMQNIRFCLPIGNMNYYGMEEGKQYSLQELGL